MSIVLAAKATCLCFVFAVCGVGGYAGDLGSTNDKVIGCCTGVGCSADADSSTLLQSAVKYRSVDKGRSVLPRQLKEAEESTALPTHKHDPSLFEGDSRNGHSLIASTDRHSGIADVAPQPNLATWTQGKLMVYYLCGACLLLTSGTMLIESYFAGKYQGQVVGQIMCLAFDFVGALDYTVIVPTALDLVQTMGLGAIASGLLISCVHGCVGLGGLLARSFVDAENISQCRRAAILACLGLALANNLFAVFTVSSSMVSPALRYTIMICIRSASGLFIGAGAYAFQNISILLVAPSQLTSLLTFRYALTGAGLAAGPLMSSTVIHTLESPSLDMHASGALQTSLPICLISVMACVLALSSALTLPSSLNAIDDSVGKGSDTHADLNIDSQPHVGFRSLSAEQRKIIFLNAMALTCERGWAVVGVEVSTAFILEVQFHWTLQAIGFGLGGVLLGATWVVLLFAVVRSWTVVDDVRLARLLAATTVMGCVLLLPYCGRLIPGFPELLLFIGDAIIYCSFYMLQGIMEGFALKATLPDSRYSRGNWLAGKLVFSQAARLTAAPVCRGLIAYLSREWYVSVLLAIALLAAASVVKTSRLVRAAEGTRLDPMSDEAWKQWHKCASGSSDKN